MTKQQPEYELQKAICKWLNLAHKEILFLSDTIASVRLTLPQQGRNKLIQKQGFSTPDLLIFQPNGKYHGLFIELKATSPYKKNGELLKNEHLEAQQKTIDDLNRLGYYACFSFGFEPTIALIEKYLNNEL